MYYFSILYSFYPFIFQGGHNLVKFRSLKLKMTTSGPVPDNKLKPTQRTASHRRDAGHPAENDRHLSAS